MSRWLSKLFKIILIPLIKKFYKLHINVQGVKNVSSSQATIIVGNQTNFISALAIEAALPGKVYWAVSPSVCRAKLAGVFLKIFFGCFLLDPMRADTKGFRSAFRLLRNSQTLAFYPGVVNEGIALFCLRSGCNILPTAITQEVLHPNRINITFGPVFNLSQYRYIVINVKNVKDLIQKINQSIEQLKQ